MYAIVDIETTGGYAAAHGITEIAVILHDGEKVTHQFESLVNPGLRIPLHITALTGISNEMVAGAPSFSDLAPVLYGMLNDRVFVAHNVNFDYSFVRHHLKACGYELVSKKLCTVRLGRKMFPGMPSYSLGNLCRQLNIKIDNRHRAGGDARATTELFEKYLKQGGHDHIIQMLKKSSAEQWLPVNLEKRDIAKLPAKPGVYYFHNSKNTIIYVGKAINIRKRVSSHFTHNDPDRKRQLFLRNIHKVTCQQCATELEAIVLESAEIKRLWPRYNRSQKQPVQRFALYQFEDSRGFLRLAIDKKKRNVPALYTFNLLHEGLVLLKKMAEEFGLDQKLCFIDKTAHTEDELKSLGKPSAYNKKVKRAVSTLSDKLPTFAVIDDGIRENEKLCLLVERGSFWGMGYIPADFSAYSVPQLKEILQPYADNDTIRNSIYSFVQLNPSRRIDFNTYDNGNG